MDLETLFHQYKEEFLKENTKINDEAKIYNTIFQKIMYLNYAILKNLLFTSRDIFFLNFKFYLVELSSFFAKIYRFPVGYDRFLLALKEKRILLEEYWKIKNNLENLLTTYKEIDYKDVFSFSVIESFIEITMDTYIKEMKEYNWYLNLMEENFTNKEKITLRNFTMVYKLQNFILKEQNNYEVLSSMDFRRKLTNKD